MNWLDMRTVMFCHIITNLLGAMMVSLLLGQGRGRFRGIPRWLTGFALQSVGSILISLRGTIPDAISIVLANTLIIAGAMAIISGLLRFIGKTPPLLPAYLLLAAYACGYFVFVYLRPSLEARTIVHSGAILVIFVVAIVLLSRPSPEFRRLILRIKLVYGFLALSAFVRFVSAIVHPILNQDFFKSTGIETLILMCYLVGTLLLTYNLVLAVNERLIDEARFQEEKFAKAFRSSPYAISLTDVETGRIIEVNEGYAQNLGYSREEAIGKTTTELRIWESAEDRLKAIGELEAEGKVHEREFRFRTKSGELITGLFSAELIMLNGRRSIISTINNISLRKKALDDLSRSVQEKELLMKELTHRVKNSLAVVSSLLGFSRETATDPPVKAILSDLRARIGSVSSVYEQLDRTGKVDMIGLQSYIRNLAEALVKSYAPTDGRVRLKMDLADLSLDSKRALPLGLILNELIINAFKYAYPAGVAGEIRLELKSVTGGVCLIVADDGIGRAAGAAAKGTAGTGTMIIETLADQIGAHISYPPGPGTTAVIVV